jgi:hypothetical protein
MAAFVKSSQAAGQHRSALAAAVLAAFAVRFGLMARDGAALGFASATTLAVSLVFLLPSPRP